MWITVKDIITVENVMDVKKGIILLLGIIKDAKNAQIDKNYIDIMIRNYLTI